MRICRILYFFVLNFIVSYSYGQLLGEVNTCGSNWLNNTNQNSGVNIGDLDIAGDQITVEAIVNRTANYVGGRLYAGDIVSKHKVPADVNYLLRPSSAEISTTNGYFITPPICDISLNKTYHVAMVYDGKQLKFYRNGFLMAHVNCTGNLFQNNYKTIIGEDANYPAILQETFIGFIGEVRIWNVARTQDQIITNMNISLLNPATQLGLLAYYTFDNLKNKQGNAAWDGALFGTATIQNTNPTCSSYLADSCSVISKPILYKSNDTSLCQGQSTQLIANVINSIDYSWSPTIGLSNSYISNPIATPNNTTVYYITAHAKGTGVAVNTLLDSIQIKVLSLPSVKTSNDTTICLGSPLQLSTSSAVSYSWLPSSGLSNDTIPNPIALPLVSTKYFVKGTNAEGCSARDSIFINVQSLPLIVKSNDTAICIGGSVKLYAFGGNNFQWLPLASLSNATIYDPVASPTITTLYKVTITSNSNSCTASDSILVKVLAKPIFTVNPQAPDICLGDSVVLTAAGGDKYEWLVSSGIQNKYSPVTIVNPAITTVYPIEIFHKICNMMDTVQTTVNVNPFPTISIFKSGDIECSIGYSWLIASGGTQYKWSPVEGLSNSLIPNPKVEITQNTKYTVTVTSSKGCIAKDTITVNFLNHSGNLYLMPNAFTPNGDGLNDYFGIKKWGLITDLQFFIYDRLGERVFFTTDPSKGWDGFVKSYAQPAGVFVYYIKAKTLCGDVEKKGTVVLIR